LSQVESALKEQTQNSDRGYDINTGRKIPAESQHSSNSTVADWTAERNDDEDFTTGAAAQEPQKGKEDDHVAEAGRPAEAEASRMGVSGATGPRPARDVVFGGTIINLVVILVSVLVFEMV